MSSAVDRSVGAQEVACEPSGLHLPCVGPSTRPTYSPGLAPPSQSSPGSGSSSSRRADQCEPRPARTNPSAGVGTAARPPPPPFPPPPAPPSPPPARPPSPPPPPTAPPSASPRMGPLRIQERSRERPIQAGDSQTAHAPSAASSSRRRIRLAERSDAHRHQNNRPAASPPPPPPSPLATSPPAPTSPHASAIARRHSQGSTSNSSSTPGTCANVRWKHLARLGIGRRGWLRVRGISSGICILGTRSICAREVRGRPTIACHQASSDPSLPSRVFAYRDLRLRSGDS